MAELTIRAEIKTILSDVTNIGNVYDYAREIRSESKYTDLVKTVISGVSISRVWFIYMESQATEQIVLGIGNQREKTYKYKLEGWLGLTDSSETQASTLITAIESAFAAKPDLNSTCFYHGFIQVDSIDIEAFGNRVCNHIVLTLTVKERST